MKLKSKWTFHFSIIVFLLVVASFLRLHTLGDQSLWMDEARQVSYYYSSSMEQLINRAASQQQPPLDYVIGYYLVDYFGFSEFIVRFPSFLFGVLLVVFVYALTVSFAGTYVAISASLLTAFSSHLVQYSQEARPYSIFFFLLFLTLFAYLIAITRNRWWNWGFLLLLIYLLLMTRGLEPLLAVLALNIVTIGCYLFLRREGEAIDILSKARIIKVTVVSSVAVMAYMPYFLRILRKSHDYVGDKGTGMVDFSKPITKLFSNLHVMTQPISLILLILFVSGLFFLFTERRKNVFGFVFLLFALTLPIMHTYVFHLFTNTDMAIMFAIKYNTYILPFIFTISMVGFVRLTEAALKKVRWVVPYALAILFIPFCTAYALNLPDYYKSEKADYRGTSRYLMDVMNPQDILIYDTYRAYGVWEPHLYGKGIYYKSINQLLLKDLAVILMTSSQIRGNVYLLLHENIKENKKVADMDKFKEERFHGMVVIHSKRPVATIRENLMVLLDEMLHFYPETSSRVDLYLAKAHLLCREEPEETSEYLKKALTYVKSVDVDIMCKKYLEK